jgi:hypothetical protein
MTASALAGELNLPLLSVRLDGLITKYLGESAPTSSNCTCLEAEEVSYSTGANQSSRTTIQGEISTYLTVACVQEDSFQVACYSPLWIPDGRGW